MFNITSKDWFINSGRIPDKESSEYDSFFEHQQELCLKGCYIDGVYIPGTLYWHLNFWNTEVDYIDDLGKLQQKYANPLLRDNEWMIFNGIEEAERQHKGICIFGSRRLGKSVFESSYIAHGATFDSDSQNVISGLNSADIKLITDKIDKGLNRLPDAFKWQKIEDNWKSQVTLGIKKKDGTRMPFSSILIRNLDDGNNEEAIAGTKPRKLVIDEFAKGSGLKALQAAIPGMTTPYGWTCSPVITATGGDMSKFQDAKELFFSPEAFNFLSFPDVDNPKRVHGLFLGAKYRQEGKDDSTLGDYLKIENKDSDLYNISIKVSNEEKAFKITEDDIEIRRKSGDKQAYLKEKMYFPKKVDDIFLNTNVNMFNVEAAKRQSEKIKNDGLKGFPVELYQDDEGVKWKHSNKEPVTEWPIKSQNPDAPVIIYEHPISKHPPKFLYVAGGDTYRMGGQAAYSDSLGALYIMKRIHSITGEGYQDMIVASYVARPDDKGTWEEQARLLLKYYNAYALIENDDLSFIEYMKSKNEAEIYLAPQPNFQKSLVTKSTLTRDFGVSRSSEKVRTFMWGLLKKYFEEIVSREQDEQGNIVSEVIGISRIFDLGLLEEIKGFYDGANVDRLVALSCALALCNELDPMIGKVNSSEQDPRYKSIFSKDKVNSKSLFSPQKSMFGGKRKLMF